VDGERLQQAVQILTTEQFTLAGGKSNTIAEANGRLSIFLSTTSSTLIAIAFIGQISHLGQAFRVFTLLLLPALLLLGLVTFVRAGQSAREDTMYTAGINRIRHFYVELVPELSDYFVLSTHDDFEGRMASSGIRLNRWQGLFSVPFVVAAINAIIGGVLSALMAAWFLDPPLGISVLVGFILGGAVLSGEFMAGQRAFLRAQDQPALFPTPHPHPEAPRS
jgi:hypothetical protein